MRLPDPSPALDKNRAPMRPEILSNTGAGVWRKAPTAFPDSSSVLDKFQSARICGTCGSTPGMLQNTRKTEKCSQKNGKCGTCGRSWATPKPSHNEPSHPHVPSWAIFLSEGFRASVRAIPSQEPATLVLKRRMGVRGSTQGPPLGGQIPPEIDIRLTGFDMTGFRCPGGQREHKRKKRKIRKQRRKKRTQPPPKENLWGKFSGFKEKLSRPVVDTKTL